MKLHRPISIPIVAIAAGILSAAAANNLPSITLTSPAPNTRLQSGNSMLQVKGRVTGSSGITYVFCVLNGDTSDLPTQISFNSPVRSTNWSFSLDLSSAPGAVPGTNVVSVFALDSQAHYSNTNSVTVFYPVTNRLTLQTTGAGTVRGLTNGQILDLGQGYPVTAIASNGWILQNWTDSQGRILSLLPSFPFLDTPDGTLSANFVNNPFPPFAGTYRGLFLDTDDGVESTNSGFLLLTMNDQGVFSGKIHFGASVYPFTGRLFTTLGEPLSNDLPLGEFRVNLRPAGLLDINLQLNIDTNFLDIGAGTITGTVSAYSDSTEANLLWTAPLTAEHEINTSNGLPSGTYNLTMAPISPSDPSLGPGGYSYGTASLSKDGTVVLTYHLADGSPQVSFSTVIARDGNVPFFNPLYGGAGVFAGWLTFTNNDFVVGRANVDIQNGFVAWAKLPSSGRNYTNGFTSGSTGIEGYGSRFLPAKTGTNLWGSTNLFFQTNYNSANNTNGTPLKFNPRNQRITVAGPNPNGLEINFDAATGLYHGSYLSGTNRNRISFQGNLVPAFKQGWGFYLDTNQQSDSVSIYGR